MKLGVFTVLFQDQPFEKALDTVGEFGVDAIEVGTGGFVGNAHCDPAALLADDAKLQAFRKAVEQRNLFISAFSCHGNPLHPDPAFAEEHHRDFRNTVLLAEKLGVERVNAFAGLPGGCETDTMPNWVTCPWPPYFSEMVKWQWEAKVIPFWKEEIAFCRQHGLKKICFEMHPGESVYNPEKLLTLREAVGEEICCNFDPSHLFWQGIDPIAAIRRLGDAIQHVHAKDSLVDPLNASVSGVLDTKSYADEINRAWIFRTVGYGHDLKFWKDFVSTLRLIGYDYVLSIEHEDSLMSSREGLGKAVEFLKPVILTEQPGAMWWV